MKPRHIFLLIVFCLLLIPKSQAQETTYLGTVAKDGYADDESYGPFNIGFTFNFYGNNYTQFYINSNGQVLFGAGSLESAAVAIPNAAIPNNYIAPFWDDLVVDSYGNILYTTIGAPPNRKLIIQFKNMGFYPSPATLGTFAVILYETTNVIQVQYRLIVLPNSARGRGGSATIGVENAAGTAGVQYAYHNPTAVTTKQAISFTPAAGPTYTVNSSAVYDWVYLTTNTTTPEPGIPDLIGPPQDAIIGSDYTFQWSSADYATSYTLLISTDPELAGATTYSAGSNLTYDITGLTLNQTYYWGVFAQNSTGTTWCEIKRFTTSSTPPLAGVPRTVWVAQGAEREVRLQYAGGDGSAKTAIVTTLPTQGHLYQVSGGVKSTVITTVPTTVTDPSYSLIYLADGGTGNGAGNFNFKIHDDTGDSPEATITINVNPPGVPNLLYTARNTAIELQFDIAMNNPSGKQGEFTVKVNGPSVTINSASLKTGDPYSIILTLAVPLSGSETVLISYTKGDVTATTGGFLASFTDQPVTLLAQTMTFPTSLTKKYGDAAFSLSATATKGPPYTYSSSNLAVATISGSTLTIHTVGTSDISAMQAGNATYAPAKYIKTLTVAKGDQTISFLVLPNKTYGDADYSISAVSGSGLPVSFVSGNTAVATVTGNTVHIVGAGSTTITASQAGNTLWNPAPDVPQTLTVNKKALTVTATGPAKTYGTALTAGTSTTNFTAGATGVGSEVVTSVTLTPNAAGLSATTAAGAAYIVTPSLATGTGGFLESNYNITYAAFNGTVSKKPLTVAATGPAKEYGTALTAGTSSSNFTADPAGVGSEAVTSVTLTPDAAGISAITAAGAAYVVTPSLATGTGGFLESNYIFTYTPYNGTVSKKTLTATADNKTKIYGDPNPALTIAYSGFVGTDDEGVIDTPPVVTTTVLQGSDAGSYPITVSGGVDNNYAFSYADGILTVEKADQTISFLVLPNKTYGDADYSLSASSSSLLLVSFVSSNLSVATVTGNTVHIAGTGTTTITASQGGSTNYNPATEVPQTLTISKASLTVTADNKTKIFGDPNPQLTVSYSGFKGTDTAGDLDTPPVVATTGLQGSAVGSYPITVTGGMDNNYNFVYVAGTLTITRIPQVITITGYPERLLQGDSYTLAASSTSGLAVLFESTDNSLATVTGDQITGVSKGSVQIRAYNQGDFNYDAAEAFVTVEVYSTHKDIMHLFTPNSDGINDYWELPDLAAWGKCDVRVFSRTGKLIYANPDYNNLWDGTSNGYTVPEGAYYYVIKTENAGEVKGTVNIVR